MSKERFEEVNIQNETIEELSDMPNEDLLFEYGARSGEQSVKTQFIEKWFPNEDEWHGKTIINQRQAHAIALVRHMDSVFTELDEIGDFLRLVLDDYEINLTSVKGQSRADHVAVMRAMFGADTPEDTDRNLFRSLLVGEMNGEENE